MSVFGKRRGEAANEVIAAEGAGFITTRPKVRERGGRGRAMKGAKERRQK